MAYAVGVYTIAITVVTLSYRGPKIRLALIWLSLVTCMLTAPQLSPCAMLIRTANNVPTHHQRLCWIVNHAYAMHRSVHVYNV